MSQLQNCSVMCTKNGSYCENKDKKKSGGEGSEGMRTKNGSYCREKDKKLFFLGWGVLGQGGCERRSEAFVKIQKKKWGGGGGQDMKIQQNFFFGGGGGQGGW